MSAAETRDYRVYCLQSCVTPGRTYIGVTNNMVRRLRQHNGKIVGGARYTRSHRPWKMRFCVKGLTKRHALQLEWAAKHKRVSGVSGLAGRKRTMARLMTLVRWTTKAPSVRSLWRHLRFCGIAIAGPPPGLVKIAGKNKR